MLLKHNPKVDTTIHHCGKVVQTILSDGQIIHNKPQDRIIGKLQRRERIGFKVVMSDLPLGNDSTITKVERKRKERKDYKFANSHNYEMWLATQKSFRELKHK